MFNLAVNLPFLYIPCLRINFLYFMSVTEHFFVFCVLLLGVYVLVQISKRQNS